MSSTPFAASTRPISTASAILHHRRRRPFARRHIGGVRERLENDAEAEFATAIAQIHRIAGFRLAALLGPE
jgi:hypothetical protein